MIIYWVSCWVIATRYSVALYSHIDTFAMHYTGQSLSPCHYPLIFTRGEGVLVTLALFIFSFCLAMRGQVMYLYVSLFCAAATCRSLVAEDGIDILLITIHCVLVEGSTECRLYACPAFWAPCNNLHVHVYLPLGVNVMIFCLSCNM